MQASPSYLLSLLLSIARQSIPHHHFVLRNLYCNVKMPAPRNIRNRSNKFSANIAKRGNVPIGKAAEHDNDEKKINPTLVITFLFLVVGSSLVQVLRLFQSSPAIPKDE